MSQSPSLAFGPAWMRPKSKQQDQQTSSSFQVPSTPISKTYTVDELLQIWHQIDINIQNSSEKFNEKYQSLEPIKRLVEQVNQDRFINKQNVQDGKDQLNDKLNDITNNWSAAEQSALDIAGILQNVTQSTKGQQQQQQQQNMQSQPMQPMGSSTSILHQQFNEPYYQQPSELLWYYLDPSGNQQGPFDGVTMSAWYNNKYLQESLNIRREGETIYYTLSDLKTGLGNVSDPFSVALPFVNSHTQHNSLYGQHQSLSTPSPSITNTSFYQNQTGLNGLHGNSGIQLSNIFGSTDNFHQPSPQSSQTDLYTQQSSYFNNGNLNNANLNRSASPWSSQQNNGLHSSIGANASSFLTGTLHDTGVNLGDVSSAGLNTGSSKLSAGSAFDFENDDMSHDDELFKSIHSAVLGDVLDETVGQHLKEPETGELQGSKAPSSLESQKKQQQPKSKKQQSTPAPGHISVKESQPQPVKANPTSTQEATSQPKSSSKPTPVAPWANATTKEPKQQLSMAQIRELEEQEAVKQSKLKDEQAKKILQTLTAKEAKQNVEIPLNWVNSNKTSTTPTVKAKSIFEIQKEEAAAEAASKAKREEEEEMRAAIAIAEASDRRAAAATAAAATFDNGNAWTTVVAKKPKQPSSSSKPKVTSTTNRISPDLLRKVSAPVTPTVNSSAVSTTNSKAPTRYEFLEWCKSTLRLNRNINVDEVLSIMLLLPCGSNESKEIIADTIYCNSSTMDGRRFANEFMKRREVVEASVSGDGLQWDDVLISFNRGDGIDADDGEGDFQVVRKGKRRN